MSEKETTPRRKWWIAASLSVVLLLSGAFYFRVIMPARETRAVVEAYNTLALGAPGESVVNHFLREPDLVCTFSEARILYFHADARTHYIPNFGDTQKKQISNLKKEGSVPANTPPFLYGYVQVLVDTESNRVTSKSWMGEDVFTYTTQGDFRYATLAELPEDVQTALHLNRGEIGHVE